MTGTVVQKRPENLSFGYDRQTPGISFYLTYLHWNSTAPGEPENLVPVICRAFCRSGLRKKTLLVRQKIRNEGSLRGSDTRSRAIGATILVGLLMRTFFILRSKYLIILDVCMTVRLKLLEGY